jgi:hypothetical protein
MPAIDEEGSITISDAGVFTMTANDCDSTGTVALTSSNNIIEVALTTTGDACDTTGDFTGFAVLSDDHDDDNDSTILNNELIIVYSNGDFGYAYPAFKAP